MKFILVVSLALLCIQCGSSHRHQGKGAGSPMELVEGFTQALQSRDYARARDLVAFSAWKPCRGVLLMCLDPKREDDIELWRTDHHLDSTSDPWAEQSKSDCRQQRRRFLRALNSQPLLTEINASKYECLFKGRGAAPIELVARSNHWLIQDLSLDQLPD